MRHILAGLLFLLTACATTGTSQSIQMTTASLPDLGPAPELTNDTWLNADSPLRIEELRGKVVAIDMWTFG